MSPNWGFGFNRKNILVALTALALIACLCFSRKPSDIIEANVMQVTDGDTIEVVVVGQSYQTRRIRLLGVDAPETVHPTKPVELYGLEASAFAKAHLTGKHVWLEYDTLPMDHYQRHLAYVWIVEPVKGADGKIKESMIRTGMFNAWLLLGGYGRTMNIEPNSRYVALFEEFQDEAQNARRGLWR